MVERYQRHNNGKDHLFKPGAPGRPPGIPNKVWRSLAENISLAVEATGSVRKIYTRRRDSKGRPMSRKVGKMSVPIYDISYEFQGQGGTVGYLCWLATNRPELFTQLLVKTLPTQITGKDGGDLNVNVNHKVARVDMSKMTVDQLSALYREAIQGAGQMVDVTPQAQIEDKREEVG
jgi:hypothetical protein